MISLNSFFRSDESDFTDLKRLIENMYTENGNKKTVLVCHSNGCNNNYYFLLQATDAWKKKYIQAWVTLGAPLGGATMGLAAVVTGDNFNIALISKTVAYDLEHTFSSIGAVLPVSSVFENITLLSLEGKDYTAKDIPQIYRLVNDTVGATMWQKSVDVLDATFPHPGVEVHCLRAIGTPTVQSLQFWSRKSFPRSPRNVFGPGDGTVNQVSSDVCLRWRDQPDFHTVEFGRPVNHMLLGTGQQTADYLIQEVLHL